MRVSGWSVELCSQIAVTARLPASAWGRTGVHAGCSRIPVTVTPRARSVLSNDLVDESKKRSANSR